LLVSIVNKNDLVGKFRIDAETYNPLYLTIEKKVKSKEYTTLGNIVKLFSKGIFDIKAEDYSEVGVPFIRISNLKNMIIFDNGFVYLDEETNEKYKKTQLGFSDIILSKTAYPAASLVNIEQCNTCQDTIAVKLKQNSSINPYYLVSFLNSKYGYYQMLRWFTGNIQMHLNLTDSKSIVIPILSKEFQAFIQDLFLQLIKYNEKLIDIYQKSMELLLREINFKDWKIKKQLAFCKNKSLLDNEHRLDAEYFNPMYDDAVNIIKRYDNGWDLIQNCFIQNKNKIKIEKDNKYNYLEINGVNISTGEIETKCILGSNLPTNASLKLDKGDLIISKVRTYRGAISIINKKNIIGSSAFVSLKEKGKLNKETLFLLLKTKPYLYLSKKFNKGTSYPTLTDNDILTLPLPLVNEKIQEKISQQFKTYFELLDIKNKLSDVK